MKTFSLRSSQSLTLKAINQRWPVKPETREKIVEELEQNISDTDPVIKMRALKHLIEIDKLNLKSEELDIKRNPPVQKHVYAEMSMEEIEERLKLAQEELGITNPSEALKQLESAKLV